MDRLAPGVELRPYDPEAPRIFAQLERAIREAVPRPLAVEHVGSTAVPGLGGKGIVDCLVIADSPPEASEVCAILRRQGFSHSAHEQPEEDRWFASGSLDTEGHGALHVHVHITYAGSRCARETLAFRDYLREHPADAARYFSLKHEWRARAGTSTSRYTELKTGFVDEILRRAQPRGPAPTPGAGGEPPGEHNSKAGREGLSMSRLRIALVGAGTGRGQSWMSTLKKLSDRSVLYDFCALCDVIPGKARESADRWGVAGYGNLLEMLDGSGPDVVLNGAPGDANVMVVGVCALRGKHVVTEIPLAPTCGHGDLLIESCATHGVVLEVAEQVWLWAQEQLKRRIIAAGLIGEPQHARMVYCNKADYHGINGVRMLFGGRPTRVLGYTKAVTVPAFGHYIDDGRTFDRWDHAIIEFDNGMTCLFESPPRGRMGPRWDLEGTLGQLVGSDLYVGSPDRFRHYPFITETSTVDGETVFDHMRVDTDPPVVFESPHKALGAADYDEVARMDILLGFHRAVTTGDPPVYGPQQARTDIEILSAMRESHDRGNVWVDLPLTGPTQTERAIEAKFVEAYGDPRDPESLADANFRQGGTRYWVANWE